MHSIITKMMKLLNGFLPINRIRQYTNATISLIACAFFLSTVFGSSAFATDIVTDTTSYQIGSTVDIDGISFGSNEAVTVEVTELDGTPITGDGGEPWLLNSDNIGDFGTSWIVNYEGTSDELLLTAIGETSDLTASTTFFVPPTNLDQLQNGTVTSPPEWSNGNINASNSCYSEGRSVPYRAFISNTSASTNHYFTIEMDWTKSTIHTIDYLTSYNVTEDSAIWVAGGPCGDSGTSPPTGCSLPNDSLLLPDPTDSFNYSGSIPTDFFTNVNPGFVYDNDQYLMAYNATIDSVGNYYFSGTESNRILNVEVYFTTDTTGSVGVFWGGHLPEGNDDGWGVGNGSASVSGAPYHMGMNNFDGSGGGGGNVSVQNSTICLPPVPLIICDYDTLCADTFHTYVCRDTSSADDRLWSVTNGTIVGDNTLDSVVFHVTSGVNPGETVTVQLTACNVNSGCPGDVCCSDASMTLPVVSCNSPPEVNCANQASFSMCELEEICLSGFSCYDLDGNLDDCSVNMGVLSGDTVCFTPTGAGDYEIILTAIDTYNETAVCTTNVTVALNSAPVASCPTNDTIFVCNLNEICVSGFSSYDADNNLASRQVSQGTLDGDSVCFTPVEGINSIEYICTDSCDLADTCEFEIYVAFNNSPVADAGSDQSIFQCAPGAISWAASCSDPDNNLTTCELLGSLGTYDGTNIYFTPSGTGSYDFVLQATDDCGETDNDTVTIDVALNSAPTVVAQDDTSLFLCEAQEICVSYTPDDPDGMSGLTETMISGYGSIDTANDVMCFTPSADGIYEFTVGVTDSCGETAQDVVQVTVNFGDATAIDCPAGAIEKFICASGSISEPLTITPDTAQVSTSFGSYAGGNLQFQADTAGTYIITVISEVECDADTCEIEFDVAFNSPPVADAGSDQSIFQCAPGAISWAASCSDPDNNLTTCELLGSLGTYDGTNIYFTPSGTGSYDFVLQATDDCGETDNDTVTIDVALNSAPTVVAQDDTSLFLCEAQEICVSYTPDDPDGMSGLTETMISGYGSIDTANDVMCFTPSADGIYEFTVGVTDSCGETAQDVVQVTVSFGEVAVIDCPTEALDVSLCNADSIIQSLNITPDSASVSVSYGIYDAGAVRFFADTSGTYNIEVIANTQCGADTCELTFNVEIGQAATINCPAQQDFFVCETDTICVPVSINGSGLTVTVSPIGTYDAGNVCFPADTSGHYEIHILAETACGDDSCVVVSDVTINSSPVADDPGSAVDTFMCAAAQICYQFSASDVDGGALTWSRLSGAGSVDANGNWCFDATEGSWT
ncbi:MAG: hypothetical protein U9N55_01285, partial [candidate division Zixibacteria bacterium]|nr:hypothetical protein [candidate division Zixibacteria bacterium]